MTDILKSMYCIDEGATIADALTIITENKRGSAVVINGEGTLLGVFSDGDIRRALIKGAREITPILKILNPNVVSLNRSGASAQESERIFAEHPEINLIPVIAAGNIVVDVAVRKSKTA